MRAMLAELGRRIVMLFRRRRLDRDLEEEMRLHLALRAEEAVGHGAPAAAAERSARIRFGNDRLLREQSAEMWRWERFESVIQDLRYGLRTMRRSPGLMIVATLSLALGIGANIAVFSLMDALLLRSLPVTKPEELVFFGEGGSGGSTDDFPSSDPQLFSNPLFRSLEAQTPPALTGVGAMLSLSVSSHGTVAGGAEAEPIRSELVSGSYFSVLGVSAAVGRALNAGDDAAPGGHPVAVASDAWWRRRFNRDPSIVGRTVTIRSTVYTIVGVAPREFFGLMVGTSPDLWVPLAMADRLAPAWPGDRLTNARSDLFQALYLVGRLRPGATASQAADAVSERFRQSLLDGPAGPTPSNSVTEKIQRLRVNLAPAARGVSRLRRRFAEPLSILAGIVGLVLLIACVNIANLLLARSTARAREFAVRQAIGAGRGRLVQQLLIESALVAGAGGALGLVFANWASHVLLRLVSGGPQPVPLRVSIDWRLLAFASAVSVTTALLFGLWPALRTSRAVTAGALNERRGAAGARSPLSRALVVAQVAVSLVLLVGAGLFLRTLGNLLNVDAGFKKDDVLELQIDPSAAGYQASRLKDLYQRIESSVQALPGVRAASVSQFTFNQGAWTDDVVVEGYDPPPGVSRDVLHNIVGAGYFAAMGIPIVAGRPFGAADIENGPHVAVINQTMARQLFPAGSPIGRRFAIQDVTPVGGLEVIGVAKDAKYQRLDEAARPADYLPHAQQGGYLANLVVRVAGDPLASVASIRRAIAEVDARLPISDVQTLADHVDRSVSSQRLIADLSAFFGALALTLTCLGLYGVMTYSVVRRTTEIGLRMALGAARAGVLWLVLRESLLLLGLGVAIGLPVALVGHRLIARLLFGLAPIDVATVVGAPVILAVVAMLAGLLPARRASRVDPMVSLRQG